MKRNQASARKAPEERMAQARQASGPRSRADEAIIPRSRAAAPICQAGVPLVRGEARMAPGEPVGGGLGKAVAIGLERQIEQGLAIDQADAPRRVVLLGEPGQAGDDLVAGHEGEATIGERDGAAADGHAQVARQGPQRLAVVAPVEAEMPG